jgi:hypothetical protein
LGIEGGGHVLYKDVTIHHNASDAKREKTKEGKLTNKLPALSAVMVSYSK